MYDHRDIRDLDLPYYSTNTCADERVQYILKRYHSNINANSSRSLELS